MPSPQVGQVISNKYRLLRHIGDGGMGSVYEARHETLGTTVALKFLHLEFARREGLVQRFLQEARASARIQSPHVIRVADVDQTTDGDVFIVLEYLEGKTLQALYEELYRGGRKLPYADALDYAEQMLDGVEAAHAAGIVHRDLKPDNVMITLDPKGVTVLKLLDFGIAKLKVMGSAPDAGQPNLTRPGVMMGTPEYMAPEQATSADTVDARADVFSLGVIIFEMLAGQRPVGGDNPLELAAAYRSGKITKLADVVPGIAPALATAVHRAIAAEPKGRFATAADMREAIAPYAAAVRAPSPSRLRAGGTIGVSVAATEQAPPGLPAPPPPTAESKPIGAGVAKTWPPDEPFEPKVGDDAKPAPQAMPVTVADPPVPAAPQGGGTVVDDPLAAHGAGVPDRTHRIGQPYAPPPSLPRPVPMAATAPLGPLAMVPSARRPRRSGLSVTSVLVTAACVAGVVTGVVYLASRSGSSGRDDDPSPHNAAPTSVATTPSQPAAPAQPADPPPFVPPQAAPGVPPRGPGLRPKPAPSSAPSGQPSSTPSAQPSAPPPPIMIPSSLPFPNPFDP